MTATLRPTRAAHRHGAAALVVAALAAGHAVTSVGSSDSAVTAPFLRTGTLGTDVRLRYADITLVEVQGSSQVDSLGTRLVTPGVFLVMRVRIEARGEPRNLLYAAVTTTDGRTYAASPSGRSSFGFGTAQPGIPQYGTVTVELPTAEVAGARLRIALDPTDQGRDDMADIAIGIDATRAAELARSTTPIPEPPVSYVEHPKSGS